MKETILPIARGGGIGILDGAAREESGGVTTESGREGENLTWEKK